MTSLIHICSDSHPRMMASPPAGAIGYFAQDAADRCARLRPRQREVLVLMCKSLDQNEIAAALGISVNTAREHKAAMYRALEVHSAIEAAILAAKAGLV